MTNLKLSKISLAVRFSGSIQTRGRRRPTLLSTTYRLASHFEAPYMLRKNEAPEAKYLPNQIQGHLIYHCQIQEQHGLAAPHIRCHLRLTQPPLLSISLQVDPPAVQHRPTGPRQHPPRPARVRLHQGLHRDHRVDLRKVRHPPRLRRGLRHGQRLNGDDPRLVVRRVVEECSPNRS